MPEVSLAQWNEFLDDHPEAHFLQTGEWGELKSAFGWRAARLIAGKSGVQILFRSLPLGRTIAYVAKPAESQIRRGEAQSFWAEVDELCRRRRAIVCKHEPDAWVSGAEEESNPQPAPAKSGPRVVRSPHSVQPRRTLIVDLTQSEETILARMKQKCRYNIRLSEKKGVTVRAWSDIAGFHTMLISTGQRDNFAVHSVNYYRRAYELFHPRGMCELLMAEFDGKPLAALMVFARGRRAWYVYGGSTDAERERMPNYLLQWEAMRWAKQRGCNEYDLWGVPDEEEQTLEAGFAQRNDGLWGVYRFKRGFGGELRRAVHTSDRVYSPLLYRAYLLRARGLDPQ